MLNPVALLECGTEQQGECHGQIEDDVHFTLRRLHITAEGKLTTGSHIKRKCDEDGLIKLLQQILLKSPEVLSPDIKVADQPKVKGQEGVEARGGGLKHRDNVYGAYAPLAYGREHCQSLWAAWQRAAWPPPASQAAPIDPAQKATDSPAGQLAGCTGCDGLPSLPALGVDYDSDPSGATLAAPAS
ncbi:MAG: hypothetical protein FRX49_02577 [Trebouxia sp. A1-2]|nr:MAG: hypothetical protein FRX49_02577 [Trebouxia sp. A1-2]